jgi:flagella basal body P-ring formation protein FlgA
MTGTLTTLVPLLCTAAGVVAAAAAPESAAVRDAITAAVAARMGGGVSVTIERLETGVAPAASAVLRAVPPPDARTGRVVSFALFDGTRRIGLATALVKVSLPHLRAAGSIARDEALEATDVMLIEGELAGVRFAALPGLADVVGAVVRRNVAAGEPLTHALVEVPPAVRSGDQVEVVSRIGAVEARGTGRASGSGYVGGLVRVSSGGSRRLRVARIVSPGVVEVLQPREWLRGEPR